MNRLMTLVVCFVAMASLGFTAEVRAETDFYHSSSTWINEDFDGGSVLSWGSGANAVATHIQSVLAYQANVNDGFAVIYSYTYVSGIFGDPASENPFYDFMENHGLYASSSFESNVSVWNDGGWYEFNTAVSLMSNGSAYLARNPDHTNMTGFFDSVSMVYGAIPISSNSSLQLYRDGNGVSSWELQFSSRYLYTGGFHLVPAPGAIALLGLGGLGGISSRRRRS